MRRATDDIPFLTVEQLKAQAIHFLNEIGRSDELPIDIEAICDDLDIQIRTVPRLERDLSVHAYISSDFTYISVDESCFKSNIPRARFSVAHELAHFVLHKEFYSRQVINSIDDYITFQNGISEATNKRMEIQANTMAGLLLVPPNHLEGELVKHFGVPAESIVISDGDVGSIGRFIVKGTGTFNVSEAALLRSLKRDYPSMFATFMLEA